VLTLAPTVLAHMADNGFDSNALFKDARARTTLLAPPQWFPRLRDAQRRTRATRLHDRAPRRPRRLPVQ
jgi:hypothetical protein